MAQGQLSAAALKARWQTYVAYGNGKPAGGDSIRIAAGHTDFRAMTRACRLRRRAVVLGSGQEIYGHHGIGSRALVFQGRGAAASVGAPKGGEGVEEKEHKRGRFCGMLSPERRLPGAGRRGAEKGKYVPLLTTTTTPAPTRGRRSCKSGPEPNLARSGARAGIVAGLFSLYGQRGYEWADMCRPAIDAGGVAQPIEESPHD